MVTNQADVLKFRPFAVFDAVANPPRPASVPQIGKFAVPATYPLRLRGVLEGVTGNGSTVSSTEYFEEIHLCANCGIVTECTNN